MSIQSSNYAAQASLLSQQLEDDWDAEPIPPSTEDIEKAEQLRIRILSVLEPPRTVNAPLEIQYTSPQQVSRQEREAFFEWYNRINTPQPSLNEDAKTP